MALYTLYDEIYRQNFELLYPIDKFGLIDYINKNNKIKIKNIKFTEGITVELTDCILIAMQKQRKTNGEFYGLLAHECLHAANLTLTKRNIKKNSEESYCYYIEWLIKGFLNEIRMLR